LLPSSKVDKSPRHAAASAESAHRETAVPFRFIVSSSIKIELGGSGSCSQMILTISKGVSAANAELAAPDAAGERGY
jgi:hypothetical protein